MDIYSNGEIRDALAVIGLDVVNLVNTVAGLGHMRPQNSLMYLTAAPDSFALDLIKWCAQEPGWEESEARCIEVARRGRSAVDTPATSG